MTEANLTAVFHGIEDVRLVCWFDLDKSNLFLKISSLEFFAYNNVQTNFFQCYLPTIDGKCIIFRAYHLHGRI
jgi:hypothetical protein